MSKNLKALEIPIVFHNYKLLKDKEWILKGSHVYFVQGPNEVGKTSFLLALQGAMTATDATEKKVSINEEGKDSGFYEFTIPAADGTIVTVRNEFTDQKNKFIAITADGEKVSKVSDIRALFNYTPINVNEFFQMSRSADGRRRQRDIILKLLPDDAREKFEDLDLQEQHYFTQRTEIGRNLETAKGYSESVVISDTDLDLLTKEQQAIDLLEKYQKLLTAEELNKSVQDVINNLKEEKDRITERLQIIDQEIESKSKELVDTTGYTTVQLTESVSKGKQVIHKINEVKAKKSLLDDSTEKEQKLNDEHENLTLEITKRREAKSKIVAEADLPVDSISFENDYLTINDFKFDENQVCESDAVLLLANILAKINPGPIQVIGDASILDAKKLEELNKIAETNGKVMFVDEVVRNADEMVIVGYDHVSENKLPTKNAKTIGKSEQSNKETKDPDPKKEVPDTKTENANDNVKNDNKPLF